MKGTIVVLAISALGTVVAPIYPVVGLALYIGLALLRPDYIWSTGYFDNVSLVVGIAMLIGWALRGFGNWRLGRGWLPVIGILGFWTFLVVSGLFAPHQIIAREFVQLISKIILPVLVGATTVKTTKELKALVWVMVIIEGYVAWEMNLSYFQGYNRAEEDGFGGMGRAVFATSLVAMMWPAIALIIDSKRLWQKAIAGVATLLIFHTILLTFSRGGMLGLIASAAVAFLLLRKRGWHYAGVLVALLVAYRLVGVGVVERFQTTFASQEERDDSAESRLHLWRDCLTLAIEHPLVGVGPDAFGKFAPRFGWPPGKEGHNLWMQTAAELGFPALFFLVFFYVAGMPGLVVLARGHPKTDDERFLTMIAWASVSALVGFMASAVFVSVARMEASYYVAMLGAIALNLYPRTAPVLAAERQAALSAAQRIPMTIGPRVARGPV
jgi:O-antigen ligase